MRAGTRDGEALGHLYIAIRDVRIADKTQPVSTDGDGSAAAYVAGGVESRGGGRGARYIGAVGHLQVSIRCVVVTDQSEAVGANRDRAVLAHRSGVVRNAVSVRARVEAVHHRYRRRST